MQQTQGDDNIAHMILRTTLIPTNKKIQCFGNFIKKRKELLRVQLLSSFHTVRKYLRNDIVKVKFFQTDVHFLLPKLSLKMYSFICYTSFCPHNKISPIFFHGLQAGLALDTYSYVFASILLY